MKYVIGQNRISGHFHVAVFDEQIVHYEIARGMRKSIKGLDILSAGFVHQQVATEEDSGYKWVVSKDRAESLNIGPDPSDELILNLLLVRGLAGLDLTNMLTFMAPSSLKGKG